MRSPRAFTIRETCVAGAAGRTAVYDAIRNGTLRARKRGRKTVVLEDDLRAWLESLPVIEPKKLPK